MSLRLITNTRKGFVLDDGRIVLQMMGAEGDADPTGDEEDAKEDENSGDEDEDSDESGSKKTDLDVETALKRMKAADRRAAAAEAKIKEFELKDKTELEQTVIKLQQAEAANEELNVKLSELRRERLFLGSNTVTWHDPEMAMSKLDWADIIDEDGEADKGKLDKAIKDLAKNKPFLVKTETADEDSGKPAPLGQPSGTSAGTGKKKSAQEASREALLKKYPALR